MECRYDGPYGKMRAAADCKPGADPNPCKCPRCVPTENPIPHPTEWAEESYVVQHVGTAGQWYDFSKCSVDPRPFLDDQNHSEAFHQHIREMMPKDRPWRLIRRLAHETLLDGHDHV